MRVETILDNIDNGAIALPEFQRGYVWNRGQVRGLMDSLYRGHPVGSLLTWLTKTEGASARGDGGLQPGTVQLLLDGQQRITTLYGLIRGRPPKFFDGNKNAFTDLRFHLDDEGFEFWQPVKMRDDRRWIDVADLMQRGAGAVIAEFLERAGADPDELAKAKLWIERVNRIDQIKQRDFHIEQVTGEDKTVDVVVEIFNRVNSGGTKLSKGDLALAKICAEWPSARDELKARLEKWRQAGFTFTVEWLLRCVNAVVTGRAQFSYLAERPTPQIREGLERAERAIDKALNTIASRLGFDHGSVLPAVYAIPVLVRYLSDRDFRFSGYEERDRLLYWYVHAAMWGRFAGSTETVLAQDLTAVIEGGDNAIERLVANLRQQRGELRVNPGDFHGWSRGARFFPILYMLTRVNGGRDWATGERLDKHMLGRYTDLELHHIFPKHVLYGAGYSRAEVNALANFAFLTLETNRDISATPPVEYFPRYVAQQPGAVESHWIPTDAALWATDQFPAFGERRRALLAAAANEFLDSLWSGKAAAPVEEVDVAATVHPELPEAPIDDETRILDELQAWIVDAGFDSGVRDHELADAAGEPIAVLDLAWPRGLQVELSEPVALLIEEPADVLEAAARYGYRVFTSPDQLRQYVEDLLVRVTEPTEDLVGVAR